MFMSLLNCIFPHGRGMALCRRPEEEKEGHAANLELAGREKRQHLASHEGRMGGVGGGLLLIYGNQNKQKR